MRIESIEIKNFRQYRNETIKFPYQKGNKDIHIIIGENGEGKTNILNALTWCLYGEELHLGDRNTAIRIINSQYVSELRDKGEKYGEVNVIVRMSLDEEASSMAFMRTATFSITPADAFETSQKVTAIQDKGARGYEYIENKDDVEMWISRYAPREINEYIFFDGELMDQYFKDAQRKKIEEGIKDLTQASLIEKTIKGINNYNSTEITPLLRRYGDAQVEQAQDNFETAYKKYEGQKEKVSQIEDNIAMLKTKQDEFNSIIKGHENLKEKMKELEEVDKKITSLTTQERSANDRLVEFTQEYYTYIALYPALKKLYDYILRQENAGNLPPKVDKNLVQSIFDSKKCSICGNKLDTEHLQHVLDIIKKLEVSSVTSAELNRASSALRSIFDKLKRYTTEKSHAINECLRVKKDLEQANDKRVSIENFLKTIPNTDEISDAISKREQCSKQLAEENQRIGRERYILEQYETAAKNAREELDKAMRSNDRMAVFKKQLDFCSNSVTLLQEIKEEILKECREEMQKETFQIFDKLIWKKGAFTKVNILDNYSFQLLDSYGEQTLGSCSAAERALLALSFTIALQKTSGHDSLLYIDTPLGRVGEKNRVNFAEVLLEVADSKQVILSFTPTEYDEKVRAQLGNTYSSYSELKYENGITTINQK